MSLEVPPYIDGDQIFEAGERADGGTAENAGGRPGEEQAYRPLARNFCGRKTAAGLHDLERGRNAGRAQVLRHLAKVTINARLHVSVERRHDRALVFPECRIDLARQRHGHFRGDRRNVFADAALVNGVEEREEETDGDSLDPLAEQGVNGRAHRYLVEGQDDRAIRRDPLGHLHASRSRREPARRLRREPQIVHLPANLAADLEDVAKPFRGDQAPLRSITALVATVVPWQKRSISAADTPCCAARRSSADCTARLGSARVEGTFMMCVSAPPMQITSVKVPPMSIPTLTPDMAPRLRR